jgi:hypothetical protein
MLAKVALQVGLAPGLVTGPKPIRGGPLETNPVKAASGEHVGDVLPPHVLFDGMGQGLVNLESDFVEEHGWPLDAFL